MKSRSARSTSHSSLRRECGPSRRTRSALDAGSRVARSAGSCCSMVHLRRRRLQRQDRAGGSARFDESHPYYALGREVGAALAGLGFTVMTGGGPGLMEAANRGARDAGGRSVGCNIELSHEQAPNRFLDCWVTCHYFFVRKVLLFKYSYAFVALPGGFGTLDELLEALTLIQTKKISSFPVVLVGTVYWRPFQDLLEHLVVAGTIDRADLDRLLITDHVADVVAHIERYAVRRFGLVKPSPLLRERAVTSVPSRRSRAA